MKDLLNCPNCGAPIQDDICPYCGSVFLDWTTFDTGKPTFVKVWDEMQGKYILLKLATYSYNITFKSAEPTFLYYNDKPYFIKHNPDITIEAEFKCFPFFDKLSGRTVSMIMLDPKKADEEMKRQYIENGKE